MKKALLTIALALITSVAFTNIAEAASVTVNTSQEESIIAKKMKEIETKKQNFIKEQEAKKKASETEKAKKEKELKAKQDKVKSDVEKAKSDVKAKQNQAKSDWEKAKSDAKAKSESNKKAAQERQKQRKDAVNNLKNSFKF